MNIALVGYGVEGKASYEYFTKRGHRVTICDYNANLQVPTGAAACLGETYLAGLDAFDLIVRSAGINPSLILEQNPGVEPKITTAINEFLRVCPTPNTIGVTGTKGKGMTSTLISLMLGAAGRKTFLAGNIGRSPLEFIDEVQIDDVVVLELSSFQLCDATHSPHVAVCLMIVPEHLNWHKDMADYMRAKSQLFRWQKPNDVSIYFAENSSSQEIASNGDGQMLPYCHSPGAYLDGDKIVIDHHTVCHIKDIKLLGRHNLQNICAAITAAWQFTHDVDAIRSVVTSFTGLPYRLEFIRECNGVKYYNDSYGTTPETAVAAIEAFDQPEVIILGGSSKNSDFSELARTIAHANIRKVILIGNTTHPAYPTAAPDIEAALCAENVQNITSLVKPDGATMAEIVAAAKAAAQPGDVVLLSAACASFDIFRDATDRGDQFNQAVRALA